MKKIICIFTVSACFNLLNAADYYDAYYNQGLSPENSYYQGQQDMQMMDISRDGSSQTMYSPGLNNPGMNNPGLNSPGMNNPGMNSPGMYSPGTNSGMNSPMYNYSNPTSGSQQRMYNNNQNLPTNSNPGQMQQSNNPYQMNNMNR
jgi:hypothetical protein